LPFLTLHSDWSLNRCCPTRLGPGEGRTGKRSGSTVALGPGKYLFANSTEARRDPDVLSPADVSRRHPGSCSLLDSTLNVEEPALGSGGKLPLSLYPKPLYKLICGFRHSHVSDDFPAHCIPSLRSKVYPAQKGCMSSSWMQGSSNRGQWVAWRRRPSMNRIRAMYAV